MVELPQNDVTIKLSDLGLPPKKAHIWIFNPE